MLNVFHLIEIVGFTKIDNLLTNLALETDEFQQVFQYGKLMVTEKNCLILAADAYERDQNAFGVIKYLLEALSERKETIQVFLAYLILTHRRFRRRNKLVTLLIQGFELELD